MIKMKRKNTFVFEYENARYEIISFKYEVSAYSKTKYIRFKYRKTEGQIRSTKWSTHFWLKDENLQTNDIDLLIENVESDVIGDICDIESFKASIRDLK